VPCSTGQRCSFDLFNGPEKHLSRVAGINQALRGALNIAAPPLGALLMSLVPFYQVISIDIITAIIAITPLFFIRIPQPVRLDQEKVTMGLVLKDIGAGFKFMKAWPGIMMLTIIAAMLNFFLSPREPLCHYWLPNSLTKESGN
jgi:DHA3 family macrolide efflux protein-like MFS transporter